jgi:hypothetical protein
MASATLTALIEAHAPRNPFCADRKDGAHRLTFENARHKPYLQLNPPAHHAWLLLDIDRQGAALAWIEENLPAPTYVAVNRVNSHAHIGYSLSSPVCKSDMARIAPLRYLAAIEHGYFDKARADFGFTGPLTKNPLHPLWELWEPANAPSYELGYLAEFVNLPDKVPPRPVGLGRNCDLFDSLRVWAYRAVRSFWRPGGSDPWRQAVLRQAECMNIFDAPLGVSEVQSIARSVASFVWRQFNPAEFRKGQSELGRLGAAAVAKVKRGRREQEVLAAIESMSVEGWPPSLRAVAKEIGCSVSTLSECYGHLWT